MMDLAQLLQDAAARRLDQANLVQAVEEGDSLEELQVTKADYEEAAAALAAPYDGCETCIVREVLAAAFQVVRELDPGGQAEFMRQMWSPAEAEAPAFAPDLDLIVPIARAY